MSSSRRLGRRRFADTALVAAALTQPLLGAVNNLAVKLVAWVLAVDEIAEAAAYAALARVKATAGFAEVGHRAQFAVDGSRGVPPAIELVAGLLRRIFVLESRVDVTDEVLVLLC